MTAIFARIRARIICSRQRELRAAFRRHRTLIRSSFTGRISSSE